MQEEKKSSEISLFRRILSLTRPYKKEFYCAVFLSVFLAMIGPIRPKLVELAVDSNIPNHDLNALKRTIIFMLILLFVETTAKYVFAFLASWIGVNIIKNLRVAVYKHLMFARLSYFDTTPIGISTTRTINDVEAINETFSEGIISIFSDVLVIVFVMFFMFAGNFHFEPVFPFIICDFSTWKIALCALSVLPVLIGVTRWFQKGVKKSYNEERVQIGRLNAFLQEHISGMKIVQIFNVQKREFAKFDEVNAKLRTASIKGIWYYSLFFPAVEICMAAAVGITVAVASNYILAKELQVGVIMSFILYINMLFRPLRFIADRVNTIQRGMIAAERVFLLLDTQLDIQNSQDKNPVFKGNVAFEKVWFAYKDDDFVLKNLSFEIGQGQMLAIVGATGSGKTSTISVLNRMYDIQKGSIKIDGTDIREFSLKDVRSQMSIVLQDVFLFYGTILENITLRNDSISREKVTEAAKAIGAHEFIMRLPNGYDYKVMERGLALSLGQRQLVSFVRALVYDPKILILDEATSSVDSHTEAVVQAAIEKLTQGRTSIVIAHRLSTIRNADKILVLEHGERKEFGSHTELLAQNGHYAKLYDTQFQKKGGMV